MQHDGNPSGAAALPERIRTSPAVISWQRDYSEEARKWAQEVGLITGNGTEIDGEPNCMWEDVLTREQFATVLYRFAKIIGKA